MFVDETAIEVFAGSGGDGCVSFRREKFVPRGGPDGGDGGRGGDVRLRVNSHLRTLSHLRHTPTFRGANGGAGKGKQMTGANGAAVIVEVPPGTIVTDAQSGELLADAVEIGTEIIVAHGGHGGRGNVHFRSPVRRTPRVAEKGTPGENRRLRLTLKLLADIGLVGLPNAGKSTLLARVSNAKPKVAGYPFTTLAPVLGIVQLGDESSLVLADLPGLIEGAHAGKGLGQRFLRHIERTRLLLIMIESVDPRPEDSLVVLRHELEMWSPQLSARDAVVCLSKADLLTPELRATLRDVGGQRPLLISARTGEGIAELLSLLQRRILAQEPVSPAEDDAGADEEVAPAFGLRPWPTRWVVPQRPGQGAPRTTERGMRVNERSDRSVRPARHASGGDRLEEARAYLDELRSQPSAEAIPKLLQALGDESWFLREHAAEVLADFGPAAAPAVEGLLRSGLWYTRAAALRVLGYIAEPSSLPAAIGLLTDTNRSIADEAARALLSYARRGRATAVAKLLHARGPDFRSAAVGLLRKIDPEGAALVQRLIAADALMGPEGSLTSEEERRLAVEVSDEAWGVAWEQLSGGGVLPTWDLDLVRYLRGTVGS